jgi:hypothetical protein
VNQGKRSLILEEKIEEHKAFLRDFQRLTSPEWSGQIGGIATIDRQLIMIDALVTTAQAELQQNYNANSLANYLYAVYNFQQIASYYSLLTCRCNPLIPATVFRTGSVSSPLPTSELFLHLYSNPYSNADEKQQILATRSEHQDQEISTMRASVNTSELSQTFPVCATNNSL